MTRSPFPVFLHLFLCRPESKERKQKSLYTVGHDVTVIQQPLFERIPHWAPLLALGRLSVDRVSPMILRIICYLQPTVCSWKGRNPGKPSAYRYCRLMMAGSNAALHHMVNWRLFPLLFGETCPCSFLSLFFFSNRKLCLLSSSLCTLPRLCVRESIAP